jgi:flagellar hook-basal body complex protein FliE
MLIGAAAPMSIGGPDGVEKAGKTAAAGLERSLGQTFSDALASLQAGEAAAIQGIQGSLPATKVVEAVMGAQRTLQSALAIRDKAVAAYQEVTRMAI